MKNSRWIRLAQCLCVLMVFGVVSDAFALTITGQDDNRHRRFTTAFDPVTLPVALTETPGWIGEGYDWSGVGWTTENSGAPFFESDQRTWYRSMTLISPQHVVAASHFTRNPSFGVQFRGQDGTIITRTAQTRFNTIYTDMDGAHISDLRVFRLDAPVPTDNFKVYPIVDPSLSLSWYLGKEVIAYGNNELGRGVEKFVGRNILDNFAVLQIFSFRTPVVTYERNTSGPTTYPIFSPDEVVGVPGDSGSPSFIDIGGNLVLLGTHSGVFQFEDGDPFSTGDTLAPFFVDQLNDIVDDDGFTIQTVVPEPATGVMVVLMGGLLVGARRRKRM